MIVSYSWLAPTSAQKYLMMALGGTLSALATSFKFVILVFTPLRRDSYFSTILGMVYLKIELIWFEWVCTCRMGL